MFTFYFLQGHRLQELLFLDGLVECFGFSIGSQFPGNVLQVLFYSDFANLHGDGDLSVGIAQGQIGEGFELPLGEARYFEDTEIDIPVMRDDPDQQGGSVHLRHHRTGLTNDLDVRKLYSEAPGP